MGTQKPFKPFKGGRVGKIKSRLPPSPARGKLGPILTKLTWNLYVVVWVYYHVT